MEPRTCKAALFAICLLTAAQALPAAGASDRTALTEQAKAAVAALATALKSELSTAMAAGGPPQAIDVCHSRAPAIAAEISQQQGVEVSRVSLRNRNPDNAPRDWQVGVLKTFQARLEAGEDAGSLTWQEIAETDGGRVFRFMKAIPTQPLCLACHGTAIAPAVQDKLAEWYPDDRATGFSEGDLRGAFVALLITPGASWALKVGDEAPDFNLPSTTGEKISLNQFRGKKIVLLEFYGADFSPV